MKKIMSLVLALALVLSMGVTVFAEEATDPTTATVGNGSETLPADNNTKVEVKAQYTTGENKNAGTRYYVTLSWTVASTLSYTDKSTTYTWDTTNMKYVSTTNNDAKWLESGTATVNLTVENRSNAEITATCSDVAYGTGITKLTAAYTYKTFDVTTGAPEDFKDTTPVTNVPSGKTTLTIRDVEGAISADANTVASFTVTISAKATTPSTSDGE